ncbi:hypothetical protein M885DRAFT_532752 [Pelagophyceae sp. CCMP2097]|nr:hypothetical protein M885DRAFT_532752 [Pelagophyceae sp. CCMP2097]
MGNAPAPRRRFHVGKLEVVYSVGDLTQWRPPNQAVGASAIVNAANEQCLGGGGVDGAVHRAAGGELRKACEQLPVLYGADGNTDDVRCETGKAVITRAFGSLRTTHVVHCVGPNVSGRFDVGNAQQDPELLGEAYRSALRVAGEAGCGSVAFPAVSCGVFGYDVDAAAKVALDSVAVGSVDFVEFVLFSKRTYDTFVAAAVADDRCVEIDQDASAAGASAEEDAFAAGACACASAMRGLVEVQPLAPTGYDTWPIWSCPGVPDPLATFPESQWWRSRPGAAKEKCFVTKGRATLLFDGERLEIKKGDFITFDRGFHCEWRVEEAIEKHYAYFDAVGEAWETTNAE